MRKMRTLAMMLALVMTIVPATTLLAIWQDKCPQQCTPTCPCSLPCDGPFGPTTCGASGQPCTVYRSDNFDLFSILEPVQNLTPMQWELTPAEPQPAVDAEQEPVATP